MGTWPIYGKRERSEVPADSGRAAHRGIGAQPTPQAQATNAFIRSNYGCDVVFAVLVWKAICA
jgi:hypothetical protein